MSVNTDVIAQTRVSRSRRSVWRSTWLLRAVVLVVPLIGWQLFAMSKGPYFLPTVDSTLASGLPTIFSEGYYVTFLRTLEQLFLGFGITCAFAIPLGAVVGRWKVADDFLSPYINTLYVTPPEALLPLLIVVFGTDLTFRIAVVVVFSFFFPLMNTAAGIRYVDSQLLEVARSFRTSRWRLFSQILLPAAAPFVVAGIRLGLGQALKGMILAELWVVVGTGGLMINLGRFRHLDIYFALALMVVAVAVLLNAGLRSLERRLQPWVDRSE